MMIRRLEFSGMRLKAKNISLLILFFISQNIFSQHTRPLSGTVLETEFYGNNSDVHSSVKPMLDDFLTERKIYGNDSAVKASVHYLGGAWNTYGNGSDAVYHKMVFKVNPIYDFSVGQDFAGKRLLYSTTIGTILSASYKGKIGIELRGAAGNSTLPNYLDSIASKTGMMPGWGDRAYANGNANYSFQHFSGNVIWRPSKIFNLQVGRDKHFWGDGYRSLFLSDVSAAMPYIKQTTTIWKLQYVSLFTAMTDVSHSNGSAKDFRNKFGTFHYISFNAAKWLNIGVFESVIWQGNDPSRQRGFDPNYLNPIIFFRPVEYSLGSSDNSMLGMAFKIRLNANNQIYAQLLLDEFYLKEIRARNGWWANKQAYQIGYKCFNVGDVKKLFLQTELNIVRPYTYTHGSVQQNYSNAGIALAHPLGANFSELIGIVSYSKKQFTVTGKIIDSHYGLDTAGTDYGQNIFISYMNRSPVDPLKPTQKDYNHRMFDGVSTNMFYVELKASYAFATAFPLRVELLAATRREHNALMTKNSAYLQIGFTLPLWRTYRDY